MLVISAPGRIGWLMSAMAVPEPHSEAVDMTIATASIGAQYWWCCISSKIVRWICHLAGGAMACEYGGFGT